MSTTHLIGIAAIRVVTAPERVRTVVGSCVGVALFDKQGRVGGLAHVILPNSAEGTGERGKFADTAVEDLLNLVLEAGAVRGRISAKIAGGACMFGKQSENGLGEKNARAVRARLNELRIPLLAEACGGTKGRKLTLDPQTGSVEMQIIGQESSLI